MGLRYTRTQRHAGRRNGFVSFISALSLIGIALGVAALIVVLSVMNGFQRDVRDRMLSVLSHIEIIAAPGPLVDWPSLIQRSLQHPEVVAAAPFVAGQAMLTHGDQVRGVLVRGIDPVRESQVSDLAGQVSEGALDALIPGSFGVVLGQGLARQLGVAVGDRLTLIAPQGTVTPAGVVPRVRQFKVVAVFASGHFEYDSGLVLMHWSDAGALFRVAGVSGVRLKTRDIHQAPRIASELEARLDPSLYARDWSRENRNWFAAVQIEKRMMFMILTLIVAVAAFNLVSMLVMTVTDKRGDIAILRTLGAAPRSIMAIFVTQGAMVGLMGTVVGVALGTLLALYVGDVVALFERALNVQLLPPGIYFISYLPSEVRVSEVASIGVMSSVLALLATLYPSLRAARVQPAEALRYE